MPRPRRGKASLARRKNLERAQKCRWLNHSKKQPLVPELVLTKTENLEESGSGSYSTNTIEEIHFDTNHSAHELKQEISGEKEDLPVVSSVSETEAPVIYQCSLCLTQFFTKSEINNHQLNYHLVVPVDFEYKCTDLFTILPFSGTPSSSSSTAHLENQASSPSSVPCFDDIPVENKSIPSTDDDDDTLKLKCKFCGKGFRNKIYRREHLRRYY